MRTPIKPLLLASAIAALPWASSAQPGAGPQRDPERIHQPADGDASGQAVYGRQLMTPEELAAHRARMRAATSTEERARIREEHHARMLERARERGVTLPDEPPAHGMGAGRGPGPGSDDRPRMGGGPGGG